jgi:hypothetical protein
MARWSLILGFPVMALGLLPTGCGQPSASGPVAEVGREELSDIWDVYQAYAKEKGKPPGSATDLKPYARGSVLGGRPLTDPNFVVFYGTAIGGANVLAYHKDVQTQGGLVLMSDGAIKPMSAADFQAAPKTGK